MQAALACNPLAARAALSKLVYRSRATVPLAPPQLGGLVAAARARNRAERVTGLVVYDEGRFLQWLEGPRDGVARIAASIRADPRHADIEILDEGPAPGRLFDTWDMQLAARRGRSGVPPIHGIEATPELLAGLHRQPEATPMLLAALAPATPGSARRNDAGAGDGAGPRRPPDIRGALERLAREAVLPHLLARRTAAPALDAERPADGDADELARVAASDATDAAERTFALCFAASPGATAPVALVERAARRLGDLWSEDVCSEAEVAIALCRLQAAVRRMRSSWPFSATPREPPPIVLVAPPPWEQHALGGALDAEALRSAGWDVDCAFPSTERDLLRALASERFDTLDLTLSPVFRRREWLPRAAALIGEARRASRNPRLAVVVSGRAFAGGNGAWREAAADAGCGSALHIAEAIAAAVPRGPPAARGRSPATRGAGGFRDPGSPANAPGPSAGGHTSPA